MEFTSFVGIDVSKLSLDASLLDIHGKVISNQGFSNNKLGFKRLTKWVSGFTSLSNSLFCMEHTGIYSLPLCVSFEEAGVNYTLQSGLQIKRSMGIQRGKNDRADARLIGRYAYLYREEIKCARLPSKAILKLKQLVSYRERLVRSKVALKTASKELQAFSDHELHGIVIADSKKHIEAINKSIIKLDKKIRESIAQNQELDKLFQLVTSVKGVGLQIATNMIIVTHGFTKFKNWRKFSCYCGLAPFEYKSGSSIRGKTRVSHLGNKRVKAIIGNGVASAIQNDPELANYYKRKLDEGKHKMLVLNAIKNKLVSRVFSVVKRGTPFVSLNLHP